MIHHLSTDQRRLQAVKGIFINFKDDFFLCYFSYIHKECLRILKPNGGQLLIYTWALEQKRRQVRKKTSIFLFNDNKLRRFVVSFLVKMFLFRV